MANQERKIFDVAEGFEQQLKEARKNDPRPSEKSGLGGLGWIAVGVGLLALGGIYLFGNPDQVERIKKMMKQVA